MATTNSAFVRLVNAVLSGATVGAALACRACNPTNVGPLVSAGSAIRLDTVPLADLSSAGYALNGAACISLSGTTPVTVDLTDLTSGTTTSAGDTAFSLANSITIFNIGAAAVTVAPGASNPFALGLAGTSPTFSIAPGSRFHAGSVAGITVDSTHKTILFTPTSGGSMSIAVGGA